MSDLISALKARQDELAHSALRTPKSNPFEHGLQAGEYMGLQYAIDAFFGMSEPKKAQASANKEAVYS